MTRARSGHRTALEREARLQALREEVAWAKAIERGERLPLMELRHARRVLQFQEELNLGRHPDMHRLMNLPRGRGRRPDRLARRDSRDTWLRELAATLPAKLTPWQRAKALAALIHGPGPATGTLAALWDFMPAKELPESVKQLHRIIAPDIRSRTCCVPECPPPIVPSKETP